MHVYKFMLIIVEYMNVYCMYMVYRMTSQRVNANDHMPQTNHSCSRLPSTLSTTLQ